MFPPRNGSAENLQEATTAERYGDRHLKRTRRQIEKKMLDTYIV